MNYLITNQNNFPNIPYPSPSYPAATVKTGGCGPCSVLNCVENMTDIRYKMADWIAFVIASGGRIDGGTSIPAILKALGSKYGFSYSAETSVAKVKAHLKPGGMAVFHSGGKYTGWPGLLSDGGHYVCVAGLTADDRAIVIDSGWYSGKYSGSWRRSLVDAGPQDGVIYVSFANLEKDRKYKSDEGANYYLISAPAAVENNESEDEEDMKTYNTVEEMPDWAKPTIKKLVTAGALLGGSTGGLYLTESQLRIFVVNDRMKIYGE